MRKKISMEKFLANARKLRKKTKKFFLTEDILDKAKNEGRSSTVVRLKLK